jgi:aerobic carbon-monoxide dehydrogenase medium subunit
MYPPPFEYTAPESLEQALALITEHGDEAKLLAGGQSLIPLLKLRFAAPALVVDLGRIPGLDTVEERDGMLVIGALARHAALAKHPLIAQRYPLMASAAPQIADPLVRNLGTIGGSLAHADPAGDWGSVMLALGAEVVAQSTSGQRVIPVAGFFHSALTTALAPNEILVQVRVPAPKGRVGGTYLKLERKVGDFATVGVAVQVELDGGRIAHVGIGLTAVGPHNLAATAAENALRGAALAGDSPDAILGGLAARIGEAAELAAGVSEPESDVRGTAEYKREVVRVFVERGLRRALGQALGHSAGQSPGQARV